MKIRVLAKGEPYASWPDEVFPMEIIFSPLSLEPGLEADFLVIPSSAYEEFAALARSEGLHSRLIAYGPVDSITESFESGAADFLREPWSLEELRARVRHLAALKYQWMKSLVSLKGSTLQGNSSVQLSAQELVLFQFLVRNACCPVTIEALLYALSPSVACPRSLRRLVSSLRIKLNQAEKGLEKSLHTIRGFGYRLDLTSCG